MLGALGRSERIITTNLVAGETSTFLCREDNHRTAVAPMQHTSTRSGTKNLVINGMRTTIDRAGRLVIPKSLREQSGITSGEVEISLDGAAIRVESVAADDLVEEDGLLLLPSGGPELDADAVRELRLADQR